ncbi:hypothetical protein AU467_19045 [Mesorhizobium loti]|uniref:Uncharacterized protein n=1 Tax=Rhizobium loti TaxID=381 RepID=A0A117N3W3_RHILI|nr:hypothetical protein AU467_19045 [Mesorhizobium loti]
MRGDGGEHRLQRAAAADEDAADGGETALIDGARDLDRLALLVLNGQQHDASVKRACDQRLREGRRAAGLDDEVDAARRLAQLHAPFRCLGGGDHEVGAERPQPVGLFGARGDGRDPATKHLGELQCEERNAA